MKNHKLSRLIAAIDWFTEVVGRALSWFLLAMMAVTCLVVAMRYLFSVNLIALQESVTYMHGAAFLLAAGYTLKHDGHVRVDIFYRQMSDSDKAWVNALGAIVFLLPFCGLVLITSWHFTVESWRVLESSTSADGIPLVYLLKTMIPVAASLLALQALAETLRHGLLLHQESMHRNDPERTND